MNRLHPLVIVLWTVILGVAIGGLCALPYRTYDKAGHVANQPRVIMETLDPSLSIFEPYWKAEIERRFGNAVGVLVHGGDFVRGEWIVGSSDTPWKHVTLIQDVVRKYQAEYPDRTIVLLACNTGHLKLGIPGVYYFPSSVWCLPDRAITPEMFQNSMSRITFDSGFEGKMEGSQSRWEMEPDICGNIYEAIAD